MGGDIQNYSDEYEKSSIIVHEEERSAIVKYPGKRGKVFRLKFIQKPNPIGFHAKLPRGKKKA